MLDPELLDVLAEEAFRAGYEAAEQEWDEDDAFAQWWHEKQEAKPDAA